MKLRISFIASAMLLAMPAAQAQQSIVNNNINNQIMETAICDGALKNGQRLPDECAKYSKYSGAMAAQGKRLVPGSVGARQVGTSTAAASASLRFTPVAGNDTLRKFADELGRNAQERQQLLQAITTAKTELFERPYGPRGWKDNVAGAYAGFVSGIATVWSGQEPSAAAEDRLFADFSAKLAPEMTGVANKDKAALYDTLIASASLPVLLYIDGKQNNNPAQMEQARTLAAEYSRKILHSEPQEVVAMLSPAASANAAASMASASKASSAGAGLDGRYECMQNQLLHGAGANFTVNYQPTGMWFVIKGGSYSTSGVGGAVQATDEVASFRGGAYDGWRGARRGDAIVFRKNDHANPRPGEGIRVGDLRCGRRSH